MNEAASKTNKAEGAGRDDKKPARKPEDKLKILSQIHADDPNVLPGSEKMIELTDQNFKEFILQEERLLIFFKAPCK